MTKADDARLDGRPPEFARYSQGLGSTALAELRRCAVADADGVLTLPREFRVRGARWPIPKYVRRKLVGEGYVFSPLSSEVLEREFVSGLQGHSRPDAARLLGEFRVSQEEEVSGRRLKTRIRSERNLIGGSKHETL